MTDSIYVLAAVGAGCWVIGGGDPIGWLKHPKVVRRFVWPGICGVSLALFSTAGWVVSLLYATGLCAVCSLPYSPEKQPLVLRLVVGAALGLITPLRVVPALFCALVMTALFNGSMLLSLKYNHWPHKATEFIVGAVQGASLAWGLLHPSYLIGRLF